MTITRTLPPHGLADALEDEVLHGGAGGEVEVVQPAAVDRRAGRGHVNVLDAGRRTRGGGQPPGGGSAAGPAGGRGRPPQRGGGPGGPRPVRGRREAATPPRRIPRA